MIVADLVRWARARYACGEALDWLATLDPDAPAYRAWQTCPQGDWLLWLAGRVDTVDRRDLVRAACDCAETALHLVPEGEARPAEALRVARAWCDGGATIEEVLRAADAAHAAYAAARTARAAYAATYAATYAAYAARTAANAANYAANADDATHREHARLVRRRLAWRAVREGLS